MNEAIKAALKRWDDLYKLLPGLNETQVKEALEYELANDKRKTFVIRLHQRYNTLRVARERDELVARS